MYTGERYKQQLWISPILVWNFYPKEYAVGWGGEGMGCVK